MRDVISRLRGLVCVLGFLLAAASAAVAQEVTVSMLHGLIYPPQQWAGLLLGLRNDTDSNFDGYVALTVRSERGDSEYQVPVHLPARSRVRKHAYVVLPRDVPMTAEEKRNKLAPTVVSAELRDTTGARKDQKPLLGRPLGEGGEGTTLLPPAITLVITSGTGESHEAFEGTGFSHIVQKARRYATSTQTQAPKELPRHPAGLAAARVIALSDCDPDELDPAQRHVLLEYVRRGGVLVVAAPDPQIVGRSWLMHHLPVELIGSRLADRIKGHDAPELELTGWLPLTEALAAEGQILLRDDHYVHAAWREMGLGRIVFTSFPLSGLKDQPAAEALWRLLLTPPYEPVPWNVTRLADTDSIGDASAVRDGILSRMIGRKVPAWGLAASIAGVYVLGVLGAQVVLRGAARPRAFGLTMVLAGILTAGLVVASQIRQQDTQPMSARIATIDIGGDGGGQQQEVAVFVGADDPQFSLEVAREDAALRLLQSFTPNDRPLVRQLPFAAVRAGIMPESYQRVWTAVGGVDPSRRVDAVGRFDENGLTVTIENELGGALQAPRVLWGSAAMSLGEAIPQGNVQRRAQRGDQQSMLVSDQDALRQAVLAALRLREAEGLVARALEDPAPLVVAFADDTVAPALIKPAGEMDVMPRSQVVVRTPLRIEASQPGQTVRVPSPLMRLTPGPLMALPYDPANNEWIPSANTGNWVVGFTPPKGIGQLRPIRATLDVNLNTPSHRVTLRGQQMRNGRLQENRNGKVLAQWTQAVGPQDLTVDLDPTDADADGTIWLLLQVEPAGESMTPGLQPQWWIEWLRVSYEAQVVGPPPALTLDGAIASSTRDTAGNPQPNNRPARR